MVTIDALSSWRDLVPLGAALERGEGSDTPIRLDLAALGRAGHASRRLDPMTVALLTNLLVGRFAQTPLQVELPQESSPRLQLKRAGLWFGLAQRPGPTSLTDAELKTELRPWARDWRPVHKDQLFDVTDPELDDERCGYYTNVHKLGPGFFRDYHDQASVPWLYDVIPLPNDRSRRGDRNRFVSSADDVAVEVFDNLGKHAFVKHGPIDGDWLQPHGLYERSLLQLSVTRGGENRLHMLALDNGYGIGRTLRWRHPELTESTADLVQKVLARKYTERGITDHAGRGLWYLHGLARTNGGTVRVVTSDDLDDDDSAVMTGFDSPRAEDGRTNWLDSERVGLPVRGTLLHAVFYLPSSTAPHRDDARQQELSREPVEANG